MFRNVPVLRNTTALIVNRIADSKIFAHSSSAPRATLRPTLMSLRPTLSKLPMRTWVSNEYYEPGRSLWNFSFTCGLLYAGVVTYTHLDEKKNKKISNERTNEALKKLGCNDTEINNINKLLTALNKIYLGNASTATSELARQHLQSTMKDLLHISDTDILNLNEKQKAKLNEIAIHYPNLTAVASQPNGAFYKSITMKIAGDTLVKNDGYLQNQFRLRR